MSYKLNAITGRFDLVQSGNTIQVLTTTERTALTPADGLVVFDTDLHLLLYCDNGAWVET